MFVVVVVVVVFVLVVVVCSPGTCCETQLYALLPDFFFLQISLRHEKMAIKSNFKTV